MTDRLKRLKDCADEAIAKLKQHQGGYGAINWARLRCANAMHISDDTGREYDSVLLFGADPSSDRLCIAVSEHLEYWGWREVEVRTEW